MKKLSLFLFLSASIFLTSCNNDSDDIQSIAVEQENLLGTWDLTGYKVDEGKTSTEILGKVFTQNYTSIGKDYDMTVTFNDDTKTVVSNGSYTIVITTSILGQDSTQEAPAYSAFEASEWKIDGSEVILINNNIETNVIISELTASKMVMVMNIDETVEVGETVEVDLASGTKTTTTGKLTITLER